MTTKATVPLIASIVITILFSVDTTARADGVVEIPWNPSFDGGKSLKVYEQAVVTWALSSKSRFSPQVEIFERTGQRRLALNILSAVEEDSATEAAVWDVAVSGSGNVAVAVLFAGEPCSRRGALITYGRDGALLSAVRVPPERSIRKLEFDTDGTIWALGHHHGNLNPNQVPLLFHYQANGEPMGSFIPRSRFPIDAEVTLEGPLQGGSPAFGLMEDVVWFWLPGSETLAVINKDGSGLVSYVTGLPGTGSTTPPKNSSRTEVVSASLLRHGQLLVQAVTNELQGPPTSGLYAWAPSGSWRRLDQPDGARLLGATASELLLRYRAPADIIRIGSLTLP